MNSDKSYKEIPIPSNPFEEGLVLPEYQDSLEDFFCPICSSLFMDAVHCSKCTNMMCKGCIENWCKKDKNCPLCKEQFKANPLVLMVKNRLKKIKMKCFFSKEGTSRDRSQSDFCQEVLSYDQFIEHINSCNFRTWGCGFGSCTFFGTKTSVNEHFSECDFNFKICCYCENEFKLKELLQHENTCNKRTVQCDRCQEMILYNLFQQHKENLQECLNSLSARFSKKIGSIDNQIKSAEKEIEKEIKTKDTLLLYKQSKSELDQKMGQFKINFEKSKDQAKKVNDVQNDLITLQEAFYKLEAECNSLESSVKNTENANKVMRQQIEVLSKANESIEYTKAKERRDLEVTMKKEYEEFVSSSRITTNTLFGSAKPTIPPQKNAQQTVQAQPSSTKQIPISQTQPNNPKTNLLNVLTSKIFNTMSSSSSSVGAASLPKTTSTPALKRITKYHNHVVVKMNSQDKPNKNYLTGFMCDICQKNYGADVENLHCTACNFDLCDSCYKSELSSYLALGNTFKSKHHTHSLTFIKNSSKRAGKVSGWICDTCEERGDVHEESFYCAFCDFDLCKKCFVKEKTVFQ